MTIFNRLTRNKEFIDIQLSIPKEIYKEMILIAIEEDSTFKDMMINAINEVYLDKEWGFINISNKRIKWIKKKRVKNA